MAERVGGVLMGRVIEHRVVGIRCDVRSCTAPTIAVDASANEPWTEHVDVLARLVEEGWGFVCKGRIRAYCPSHARRVYDCVCDGNRRVANCTVHSTDARAGIWHEHHIPAPLAPELTQGATR